MQQPNPLHTSLSTGPALHLPRAHDNPSPWLGSSVEWAHTSLGNFCISPLASLGKLRSPQHIPGQQEQGFL